MAYEASISTHLAERRWPGGRLAPVFAGAIRAVHDNLASLPALSAAEVAACCFPDQPLTIVPLALGLATVLPSAEEAILLAANLGGDSDSVASISGGILGAMYPSTVNEHWCQIVENVNHHGLSRIGDDLAQLRRPSQAENVR